MNNFGASIQEWEYLTPLGSDCRYIVPIVSNPMIVKNAFGQVTCLAKWQIHETTGAELKYWQADPDYGYGFRTGHNGYIAVDCDIDDWDICTAVHQLLANALDINWRELPIRTHGQDARWATLRRLIHFRNMCSDGQTTAGIKLSSSEPGSSLPAAAVILPVITTHGRALHFLQRL